MLLQEETHGDEHHDAPQEGGELAHELETLDEELHEELGVSHDDGHGEHATALWQDTALWVFLPFLFVVFILFGLMKVHKTIGSMLDKRGEAIASELEQARALREEAQELLAKYQRRQREAEEEAQAIIDQAKRDAKRMAEETRETLDEQLARRTRAAEDKIARAEAQAVAEVRNRTADIAVAAAEQIVRQRLDSQAASALVDKAIVDVRGKLN